MKKRSGLRVMLCLAGLVKPLAGYMVLAILMGLLGNLTATFITVFGGYGVVSCLGFALPFSLKQICMAMCLFALLRGVLRYGEQACNHFIAFKLLALIRERVFQALRRLCPAKLECKEKGDLIAVITSDIELLEVFYAHTISPVAIALCYSLGMGLFLVRFHPLLGLIGLVAYGTVGIVIPVLTAKYGGDHGLRLRTKSGELSGYVLDSLRGLSEILQYGQGQQRLRNMEQQTEALALEEMQMKRNSGRNQAVTGTVILLFDLLMLSVAAMLHQKGLVDACTVLLATLTMMSSFGPVVALANLGSTLQNTIAAGNRVLDLLEETPVVQEIEGKEDVSFTGASADNITFSYGQETILDRVSVEMPKGAVVGITGKSGSGKSTLLKLFMRFWEVQEGDVRISNVNVNEINTANLRNMESLVTQETHLFHDSIRNNLRIAKLDATDEEIERACQKASVDDFIRSLPKGYDTPAGELGDMLSGGERQRLGLARAFLHDSPLLLLDEPTSNLDSLNEAVILKSIKEEKENRTVVLVSHRKSTMCIVEKLYSMAEGRLSP